MLYEFVIGKRHVPIGGCVACHDWDNGKSNYIRPVISNDSDWNLVSLTIALAIYQRVARLHDPL
jgi:hypothetical protein